jgi:hypothetical protein
MTGTAETTMARVASRDGTEIGWWTSGQGPPLVLVYGAVAAALPDARVVALEGQQHVADILDPEGFAGHLVGFLRGRR